MERLTTRRTSLGPMTIWRALPVRSRRTIGPWCFLDRYGPISFTGEKAMDVAPHPHIGIQTVSWLFEGEVLHRDSLGCEATVRAGGVNVMTSGAGIAHAEETPRRNIGKLNGVQLWIALPDAHRGIAPSFHPIASVPSVDLRGGDALVFAGSLAGVASPAPHYSPIVGAELHVRESASLELDPAFEHGVFVCDGNAELEGQGLETNTVYYLEPGRAELAMKGPARVLLLGGAPFPERILMWWNFVARTPEEIAAARVEWEAEGERFGVVRGYDGPRLHAPELSRLAPPNPAS